MLYSASCNNMKFFHNANPDADPKAQYTPPTRRNCRVSSRRRCVHEFATSWRQFRRVVGVNTPVGSRELHGSRPTAALCVRIAESVGSRREFMYTPPTPTRRDSTVSSRRRRRCVLGLQTRKQAWICMLVSNASG